MRISTIIETGEEITSKGGHTIRMLRLLETLAKGAALARGSERWGRVAMGLKIWKRLQVAWVRIPQSLWIATQPRQDSLTDWKEHFANITYPLFLGTFSLISLVQLMEKYRVVKGFAGFSEVPSPGGLAFGSLFTSTMTGYAAYCYGYRAERLLGDGEDDRRVSWALESRDTYRGSFKYAVEGLLEGVIAHRVLPKLGWRHQMGIAWGLGAVASVIGGYQTVVRVIETKSRDDLAKLTTIEELVPAYAANARWRRGVCAGSGSRANHRDR